MSDLETFKKLFDPERYKEHPGKLEIRASNLDQDLNAARQLIADNKLKLEAVTDGMLASYRAFEVREI